MTLFASEVWAILCCTKPLPQWLIQCILMPRPCPKYIDICWIFAYITAPDHTIIFPCINTTSEHLFHALAQLIYTNLASLLGLHSAYHIKAVNGTERQTYFYYNQKKRRYKVAYTTRTYQVLNGYKWCIAQIPMHTLLLQFWYKCICSWSSQSVDTAWLPKLETFQRHGNNNVQVM